MQSYIHLPNQAYSLPTVPYHCFEDMHKPALLPTLENAEFMSDQLISLNPTSEGTTGSNIPDSPLQGESAEQRVQEGAAKALHSTAPVARYHHRPAPFFGFDGCYPQTYAYAGRNTTAESWEGTILSPQLSDVPNTNIALLSEVLRPSSDEAKIASTVAATHLHSDDLMFATFVCANGGGLRLDLVLRGDMQGLQDPLSRDCFQGFGEKISYKIPRKTQSAYAVQRRCKRSWHKQPVYITRTEVVRQIAAFTRSFIESVLDFHDEPGFEDWRAGYDGLENFLLIGLKRISRASVQPVFKYRPSS